MFAFKLFTAGLALLAPLAAAYTQPTGDSPEGNPIYKPGMGDILPVGQPYEITWGPTTNGTVTLVLLKGPSNNAVQQYAIATSIDNTGSYSWTPSTSLTAGTSGYGILLIVDATGQFQYSTQFGIKNDDPTPSSTSSSSSAAATATTTGASSTTSTVVIMMTHSSSTTVATVTATTSSSSAASTDDSSSTSSSVTQIVGTNSAPTTTLQTSTASSSASTSSAPSTTSAAPTSTATPFQGDAAAFRAGSAVGLAFAAVAAVLVC